MAREPRRGRRGDRRDSGSGGDGDLVDKLVSINRVTKVVKGGRRFGFAALVVVGDARGRVGFGTGKEREVPEAIRKATEQAKRGLVRIHLREGRTLHHDVTGASVPDVCSFVPRPPAPASLPAGPCAPCSRPWASRTW